MPHAEEKCREFTPELYPPFPDDTLVIDLPIVALSKLLNGNVAEQDKVFEACTRRGFFYLELGGCDAGETILNGAGKIAAVSEGVFRLPLEEKMRYKQGKQIFGYKWAGSSVGDQAGTRDTAEFFNVAQNDMMAPDDRMRRPWPSEIMESKPLFASYSESAHFIGMTVLSVLAERLGIDPSEFANRHRIEEPSGDHVRLTRGPPRVVEEMAEVQTPSHTDGGTITILMNWLGGLQVWSESARKAQLCNGQPDVPGEWQWVKPQAGCAIVNLGDAAVRFSDGRLCAGRHRVIPAPGVQGRWPRYSVVYFVRPEDCCVMTRIKRKDSTEEEEEEGEDGGEGERLTATEWIYKQTLALGNNLDGD